MTRSGLWTVRAQGPGLACVHSWPSSQSWGLQVLPGVSECHFHFSWEGGDDGGWGSLCRNEAHGGPRGPQGTSVSVSAAATLISRWCVPALRKREKGSKKVRLAATDPSSHFQMGPHASPAGAFLPRSPRPGRPSPVGWGGGHRGWLLWLCSKPPGTWQMNSSFTTYSL